MSQESEKAVAGNPQNVFNNPNQQCYTQFFVGGQPPQGLRDGITLQRMRYICQQGNQQGNQQTFFGTMFDELLGIPLFSAYTLSGPVDVNFQQRNAHHWMQTPGIQTQGSDAIYPSIPYDKGHLVPSHTYSSTQQRHRSTYTFTNAVPQRPTFNRGQWSQFEGRIRDYAEHTCIPPPVSGVLYLLTGSSFAHIVQQGNNPPQANAALQVCKYCLQFKITPP
ncbi:DNA/RNA non-specific endonuclease [Desmophyllum pertusum]|uniref:DNA/RNA non-specific endonuclease n=1 Tax=Desmophyllum pertusum TaxID=174260 RepID=A0A9W9YVL8_9CNID|nr:DNA/RNA non-specific endonuclease [Desmophyllum pertusum]